MSGGVEGGYREVIVGRNSKVWRALAEDARLAARFRDALSHHDVDEFSFTPRDRVWVFAYSRDPAENSRLLKRIAAAGVQALVYVSSASTIVTRVTQCYEYPRVKRLAEQAARQHAGARVLSLGLVHASPIELPGGTNAATTLHSIAEFLLDPSWPEEGGTTRYLFAPLRCEHSSDFEAGLHRVYGTLQGLALGWPCLLRPLDYLLRLAGCRWYGYIHLSNRLWYSTTS